MSTALPSDPALGLNIRPTLPKRKDWRIGCVGAGFIMRDCHLVAYRAAGFNPVAIASHDPKKARAVAARHSIPGPYNHYRELLDDERVEVLDVAVPPDVQVDVIRDPGAGLGALVDPDVIALGRVGQFQRLDTALRPARDLRELFGGQRFPLGRVPERRDHQVARVVRKLVEDHERLVAAREDEVCFVVRGILRREVAEDALWMPRVPFDVRHAPGRPETLH